MKKNIKWIILELVAVIIIIVGISLIVAGVNKGAEANAINVPKMTEDGWFQKTTEQRHLKVLSDSLIAIGSFLTSCGGIMFIVVPLMKIQYQRVEGFANKNNHTEDQIASKVKDSLSQNKSSSNRKNVCAYCGAAYSLDANACPNCGAKTTRSKDNY